MTDQEIISNFIVEHEEAIREDKWKDIFEDIHHTVGGPTDDTLKMLILDNVPDLISRFDDEIPTYTFYKITHPYLTNVQINAKEVGSHSFTNSSVQKVRFTRDDLFIGINAFYTCEQLKEVTFDCSISEISDGAFDLCRSLEIVRFNKPSPDAKIRSSAFQRCTGLEEVVLPDGLVRIYSDCFRACRNLKKLYIPHSVTEIDDEFITGSELEITFDGTREEWDERTGYAADFSENEATYKLICLRS